MEVCINIVRPGVIAVRVGYFKTKWSPDNRGHLPVWLITCYQLVDGHWLAKPAPKYFMSPLPTNLPQTEVVRRAYTMSALVSRLHNELSFVIWPDPLLHGLKILATDFSLPSNMDEFVGNCRATIERLWEVTSNQGIRT